MIKIRNVGWQSLWMQCGEEEEVCSQRLAVIKIRNAAKNVPVLA
jgi:hypothetical protein